MSPKLSKSYLKFEKVIKRALNLVAMQDLLEKKLPDLAKPDSFDFGDLSRSAVVLSVAAMDAYFTDVFMENDLLDIRYCYFCWLVNSGNGDLKDVYRLLFFTATDGDRSLGCW